jgi:hypothetical protein
MLIIMWLAMVTLLAVYLAIGMVFRVLNARRLARSAPRSARGPRHGEPVLSIVKDAGSSDGVPRAVIVARGSQSSGKTHVR